MRAQLRKPFGRLLIITLVLNSFAGFGPMATVVQAQDRVIIVNAEQPNVWTLEQAHYLLAQMHRRNLDLKAKSLEDLDPNEINGLRFEVMKMLIEFGATFNQADLASNKLLSRNQEFNTERREELISERDRLRKESLRLTGEIDDLETEKADAESEEEKGRIEAKIASRKARRDKVDKEIEFLDSELGTLTAPSGQLKPTEGGATFNPNSLPKSVFDKAFEEAAAQQIKDFNEAPRLNATLRLENFLQMQYEIIAKQLTLLRDEVGPGERLLFLELPQTVNVTHHEANKKWAQSWWRIIGYTKQSGDADPKTFAYDLNKEPPTATSKKMKNIIGAIQAGGIDKRSGTEYVDLDGDPNLIWQTPTGVKINNRLVRTVELIPRQSSLNVNDMKLDVRAGAFNIMLSTLFGFGSRLNVQRQREQFSQFVQQELYSSAFGKGAREFGWTFTPMPGTDRLLSGVRTTFAIVVVPEEATALVMESNGCYFPRTAYPPNDFQDTTGERWQVSNRTSRNCREPQAFVAPIPVGSEGRNDFWVRGVSYQPVGKNKRAVVLISGSNFSSQMGVLVNGVPLAHSIGLAQPLIRDDSRAGAAALSDLRGEKVRGRIERVDDNKIVFSVEIDDFEGTPTITLVAPGKAIDINWLDTLDINGIKPAVLSKPADACDKNSPLPGCRPICENALQKGCLTGADQMFLGDPVRPFRIDSVEAFRSSERRVNVLITGAGFKDTHNVFINGVKQLQKTFVSPTLLHAMNIPAPADDKIQVTVATDEKTIKSTAIVNPTQLKIDKVTVISYEAASGKKPGVLVVRIEGTGFPTEPLVSPRKVRVDVTSSTEAFLTIPNPDETEVVTLKDPVTKLSVSTVVARKPPK
jgi:hypothetical protein